MEMIRKILESKNVRGVLLVEGFTRYWRAKGRKSFTDDEWNDIIEKSADLIKELKIPLIGEDDNPPATVNEKMIWLNGVGEAGHETFVIKKKGNEDFDFCKTAQKPYDAVVKGILKIISEVAPGVLEISSDESQESEGKRLNESQSEEDTTDTIPCPDCGEETTVQTRSSYDNKTQEQYSWMVPSEQECEHCGQVIDTADYERYEEERKHG